MDAEKVLEDIANMSVDCAKAMEGKYPKELIEAFTLAGKYTTIGALKKEVRKDIDPAVGPDKCPLCLLYLHKTGICKGCVLQERGREKCGEKYDVLRNSIENGTFLNAAFHLGNILREILKKWN
jgi:hypothetical protein